MEKQIFRKKSIDRISSPEQLNDYLRVSNPGIWMILVAIIILIVGFCVWGVLGRLDTNLTTAAVVKSGTVTSYVKQSDIASVEIGQKVQIDGKECVVAEISEIPFVVTDVMGEYAMHIGAFAIGEWVYEVKFKADIADGVYQSGIIIDSVSPMFFIFN